MKLKSPKARCRLLGCMTQVPPEGYYSGMPQSHCPRGGMKTSLAAEGNPNYSEPTYPIPDWPFMLVEKLIAIPRRIINKLRSNENSSI